MSYSICQTLSRAFLRPLISNSSRVRRKGLGTRLACCRVRALRLVSAPDPFYTYTYAHAQGKGRGRKERVWGHGLALDGS